MKVLGIYDNSGPKYHRIFLPLVLMPGVDFTFADTITEENCQVDVVFANRAIKKTSLQNICDLRDKYGFRLIMDFDDHWRLDPTHILYRDYQERQLPEVMEAYILEADAVTVTHCRLHHEVIRINKNCHVIPNAIPKFGQFTYKKTESELTRLFWAGSITHKHDIELLRNPVKRFKSLPVKMVMGGYAENPTYKQMASAFTCGGNLPNNIIQSLPVEQYYAVYSECDISLVPLVDNSFNRYKSNLKILEAANNGSPVIVSNVHPYKSVPFVNYVNSQGDWYRHVKYLLKNPEFAKDQAQGLSEYCAEHFNFDKINNERKQLFDYVTGKQREVREVQVCAE